MLQTPVPLLNTGPKPHYVSLLSHSLSLLGLLAVAGEKQCPKLFFSFFFFPFVQGATNTCVDNLGLINAPRQTWMEENGMNEERRARSLASSLAHSLACRVICHNSAVSADRNQKRRASHPPRNKLVWKSEPMDSELHLNQGKWEKNTEVTNPKGFVLTAKRSIREIQIYPSVAWGKQQLFVLEYIFGQTKWDIHRHCVLLTTTDSCVLIQIKPERIHLNHVNTHWPRHLTGQTSTSTSTIISGSC